MIKTYYNLLLFLQKMSMSETKIQKKSKIQCNNLFPDVSNDSDSQYISVIFDVRTLSTNVKEKQLKRDSTVPVKSFH